jgi:hypothetical protein
VKSWDIKEYTLKEGGSFMCNNKYNTDAYITSSLTDKIDITRIVKYVCIAAVLIVAVIFSSKSINAFKALKEHR